MDFDDQHDSPADNVQDLEDSQDGIPFTEFYDHNDKLLTKHVDFFKPLSDRFLDAIGRYITLSDTLEELDLMDCVEYKKFLNPTWKVSSHKLVSFLKPVKVIHVVKVEINDYTASFVGDILHNRKIERVTVVRWSSPVNPTLSLGSLFKDLTVGNWNFAGLPSDTLLHLDHSWPPGKIEISAANVATLKRDLEECHDQISMTGVKKWLSETFYSNSVVASPDFQLKYVGPESFSKFDLLALAKKYATWSGMNPKYTVNVVGSNLKQYAKGFVSQVEPAATTPASLKEQEKTSDAEEQSEEILFPATEVTQQIGEAQDKSQWPSMLWKMDECWKHLTPPKSKQLRQGSDVKICVIDSGCDLTNPLLKKAGIAAVRAFYPGARLQDLCIDPNIGTKTGGHGTACVSVIVGRDSNTGEAYGIAPEAEIYVASIGSKLEAKSFANAIEWACEKDCQVISISLSWLHHAEECAKAIQMALSKGIIIIVASSNYGKRDNQPIVYPARYGGLIVVGSHDRLGHTSKSTSLGRELDFLAPGENIRVASHAWDKEAVMLSGSSFAAPFVSGLAALLIENLRHHVKKCGTEVIRLVLRQMAAQRSHSSDYGYGRLDPHEFFETQFENGKSQALPKLLKRIGIAWQLND
jgi:membrane-anchored mycosin MYCP